MKMRIDLPDELYYLVKFKCALEGVAVRSRRPCKCDTIVGPASKR